MHLALRCFLKTGKEIYFSNTTILPTHEIFLTMYVLKRTVYKACNHAC